MGKGKVTKRERKFQASGGVKNRIKKGTVTKKGKLRMRKKGPGTSGTSGTSSAVESSSSDRRTPPPQHGRGRTATSSTPTAGRSGGPLDPGRSNDFLGEKNLAGLDLDSFFAQAADEIEKGEGDRAGSDDDNDDSRDSDGGDSESGGSSASDRSEEGGPRVPKKRTESTSSSSDDDSGDDSGSDDDDEEDVEKAEARMKKQMASMERSDPSFHQFLKENEGSLLEFGEDGDDDDADDDEDGASEDGSKASGDGSVDGEDKESKEDGGDKAKKTTSRYKETDNVLTHKALEALLRSAFEAKGIKGLKKLVGGAYRSACHLADPTDEAAKARPGESGVSYRIDSSKVFDDLMVSCLGRCHEAFRYHLLGTSAEPTDDEEGGNEGNESENPTDENKPINPKTLENSAKWGDIKPILLSFFRSTLHLLYEAKEPKLLTLILRALAKYVPLLSPFPHVASSALKALLQLWSAPLESSEDYQVVRLHSFLRIRQLALTQPFPFIEECMKRSYHSYASRAKFGASASQAGLPTLTFMGNCIVELYSLDYHSAYQHAFVYVRQLALLLRGAMHAKTTDNVYCWQYVHSLKLWTAVLSASAAEEDGASLRSLVYPLTEVVLGTVRLSPSPRHLPLRLQCVRLLQQLAAATETFVPTASIVLDCLDYKEWYLAPKKSQSSPRALQMDATLRLPSTDKQPCLRTREQLDPAMAEIMVLLQHEVELYRYNPGFPEYAVGIEQRLRKFVRDTREMRWKAFARGVIDLAERYSSAAVQGRSRLADAPRDVRELECLRPIDQPTMRERLQSLLEKERKASAVASGGAGAIAPSAKKGASHKRGHGANGDGARDDDDDDDDGKVQATNKNKKQKRSKASDPRASVSTKKQREGGAGGRRSAGSNVDEEDEVQEGIDWSDGDEE